MWPSQAFVNLAHNNIGTRAANPVAAIRLQFPRARCRTVLQHGNMGRPVKSRARDSREDQICIEWHACDRALGRQRYIARLCSHVAAASPAGRLRGDGEDCLPPKKAEHGRNTIRNCPLRGRRYILRTVGKHCSFSQGLSAFAGPCEAWASRLWLGRTAYDRGIGHTHRTDRRLTRSQQHLTRLTMSDESSSNRAVRSFLASCSWPVKMEHSDLKSDATRAKQTNRLGVMRVGQR